MVSTAGIIIIGDEILSGRTKDTNINWIATELNNIGVRLIEARIISDDSETKNISQNNQDSENKE